MSDLLQFFSYSHLPAEKQGISKPFGDFAQKLSKKSTWDWGLFIDEVDTLLVKNNIEKEACLKKLNEAWNSTPKSEAQYRLLLEAKDCAVRSSFMK